MVRPKMDREERAKQFMPFAALKGSHEALRKKEREVEEWMELEGRLRLPSKNDMMPQDYEDMQEYGRNV